MGAAQEIINETGLMPGNRIVILFFHNTHTLSLKFPGETCMSCLDVSRAELPLSLQETQALQQFLEIDKQGAKIIAELFQRVGDSFQVGCNAYLELCRREENDKREKSAETVFAVIGKLQCLRSEMLFH
jgi:hypothetical protein